MGNWTGKTSLLQQNDNEKKKEGGSDGGSKKRDEKRTYIFKNLTLKYYNAVR